MQFLSNALPILLGGIIGYVTNDLAIKMLFRPYKPVYIGRFRLPFTPGIVARRQEELSVMLGREVEAQFFNASDLEILFQSDIFPRRWRTASRISCILNAPRCALPWKRCRRVRTPVPLWRLQGESCAGISVMHYRTSILLRSSQRQLKGQRIAGVRIHCPWAQKCPDCVGSIAF